MFIQLNDLLQISKALIEENSGIELPIVQRGRDQQYKLMGKNLAKTANVEDLGIYVAADV